MKHATIADAPAVLNTNDKAMWVLGYNAAVDAMPKAEMQWPFTGMGGGLAITDLDEQDSPDDAGVGVGGGGQGMEGGNV
jgi:hypothetical protein